MTKSYRNRNLSQRCQLAKSNGQGQPRRDDQGNVVLDHGGLWFLKVSGNAHHDRKRLVPEDAAAFFRHKATEIEAALKAKGKTNVSVTPERVYEEYVKTFTHPNHTYAPAGQPEEFSLVVPKGLCVNWCGASFGDGDGMLPSSIPPEQTSIFARLCSGEEVNDSPAPVNGKGRRRKPEAVAVPVEDDENEQVFED